MDILGDGRLTQDHSVATYKMVSWPKAVHLGFRKYFL